MEFVMDWTRLLPRAARFRGEPRRRRFRPVSEAMEGRLLLDAGAPTATATATAATLTGRLSPGSDSGPSSSDGVTNITEPVFQGQGATPYALVQLFAQTSNPTKTIPLGQGIADANGDWSLISVPLHDGYYTITATQTAPGGFPSPPVPIMPGTTNPGPLVIDTIAPRVAALSVAPDASQITVVFQETGSGLDPASLGNPLNYVFTRARIRRGSGYQPESSPSISGFYSNATAETVQVAAGSLPPGSYLFQVRSGGVADLAGNPLDGEYLGAFPSGDGRPGGNFIVSLNIPRVPHRPSRPHAPLPGARRPPHFAARRLHA